MRRSIRSALTCVVMLGYCGTALATNEFDKALADDGKHHLTVAVSADDDMTSIPITVVNGQSRW